MPAAIPLVAAAGSVAGGLAAISAGSAVVGGLMVAGGAMTAVGTLTGDKTLTRLGGLASLAGGVAGLATDAWSVASEVSGMDLASDAAAGTANNIGTAAQAFGGAAPGVADAGIQAANQAASTSGGWMMPNAASAGAPTITAPAGGSPLTNPMAPTPTDVRPAFDFQTPATASLNAPAPTTIPAASGGGMLQSLSGAVDWAKANPRLVQAGAGILSATMSSYAQQEAIKTQLRLEEEARQRQRDRMNQSIVGLKVPTYQRPGA